MEPGRELRQPIPQVRGLSALLWKHGLSAPYYACVEHGLKKAICSRFPPEAIFLSNRSRQIVSALCFYQEMNAFLYILDGEASVGDGIGASQGNQIGPHNTVTLTRVTYLTTIRLQRCSNRGLDGSVARCRLEHRRM